MPNDNFLNFFGFCCASLNTIITNKKMQQKTLSAINVPQKRRRSSLEDIDYRQHRNNAGGAESQEQAVPPSNKEYLAEIPAQLHGRISLAVEAEVLRRVNEQTDKQLRDSFVSHVTYATTTTTTTAKII
ncbi:hypothetical protein RFI_17950 [Reticulomyxa filosa]|uniref:Uncharacterized protein n=1 Tax=Reticulomyxa filosa TaxID=46433 RepID=X6MZN8_RETFI|nr:hypothetical protein RFI_17950 [Reticulomyxa filosa]|eukprot:ETO19281.1 hypothetical protein RFI_17950 [Reticulomyxa filosa]